MCKTEWEWFLMNLFSPQNLLLLGVFIIIIFIVFSIYTVIKILEQNAKIRKEIILESKKSEDFNFFEERDKIEEENKCEKNNCEKDEDKILKSVTDEQAVLVSNFIKMKKFMMEDLK